MPDSILPIINEFADIVKHCIHDELSAVIVYGSYARGDYHSGSDIDIMILVDTEDEKIKKYEDEIYDRAFDMELKHDRETKRFNFSRIPLTVPIMQHFMP